MLNYGYGKYHVGPGQAQTKLVVQVVDLPSLICKRPPLKSSLAGPLAIYNMIYANQKDWL